jgi:hypothetical protein
VKAAVASANEILNEANARLTVIKVNKDVSDRGNDDGARKGKKIVFAKSLPKTDDGKVVTGVSTLHNLTLAGRARPRR